MHLNPHLIFWEVVLDTYKHNRLCRSGMRMSLSEGEAGTPEIDLNGSSDFRNHFLKRRWSRQRRLDPFTMF